MGALPDYKDIMELVKRGLTLEAQEKIMELRTAALQLTEENIGLREELRDLKRKSDVSARMHFRKPFYHQDGDDQPFCPICWESQQQAIHVDGPIQGQQEYTHFECKLCEKSFITDPRYYHGG